jgi:hypothetical protein
MTRIRKVDGCGDWHPGTDNMPITYITLLAYSVYPNISLFLPLLNFEWVTRGLGCRSVGVKGGRSPA